MNARIKITGRAGDGDVVRSIDLSGDHCSFDVSITAGDKTATIRLRDDLDGNTEFSIDSEIIELFGKTLRLELERLIAASSIVDLRSGDINLSADRTATFIGKQLLQLGASVLKIGTDALFLNSKTILDLVAATMAVQLSSGFVLKAPTISLQGNAVLGSGDVRPIARVGDTVKVFGVKPGNGTAEGLITTGGRNLSQ